MRVNALTNCQSKKSYPTKQQAEETATYLFYQKGFNLDVYRCNLCEMFHLTKSKDLTKDKK
jgi:hypothetical protein